MTILLFFNDTRKLIIPENSANIFNRGIVNVLLEPYSITEGINFTYDDISTIIINDFFCDSIEKGSFPKKLIKLELNRTTLKTLPSFPLTIEQITIGSSDIHLNEDFRIYPNLKKLNITVMAVINNIFPDNLYKQIHCAVPYITGPMSIRTINDYRANNRVIPEPASVDHLVNNSQSVHISSINKTICDSIEIINELANTYPPVINPLDIIFKLIAIKDLNHKKKTKNIFIKILNWIVTDEKNDIIRYHVKNWLDSTDIHILHQITFATLFEKIIRIIINHEHKEGLLERLMTELHESIGLCFTGRMNRLVNSLAGIVDGIKVSFSVAEQLQLESSKIIERLNNKTITFAAARLEMLNLFNDDEVKLDISLIALKEAYISALDDFKEDYHMEDDPITI